MTHFSSRAVKALLVSFLISTGASVLASAQETVTSSKDSGLTQRRKDDDFEIAPFIPRESFWLSYSNKGGTFGGAIGWRNDRRSKFGFEVGFSDTSQVNPFDVSLSPPPFSAIPVGVYNTGPLLGFDTLYFFGSRDVEFFAGIGFYFQSRTLIGRVPGVNVFYNLGETADAYVGLSFGTRIWVNPRIGLGASYHSERGSTLTLAFRT